MRETKQEVIDEIRRKQNLAPLPPGKGSSVPRDFFEDLAREMGLGLQASMPDYARAILSHVGIRWQDDFSSENSPSGGGSTVTYSGLCAIRDAYALWLNLEDPESDLIPWRPEENWLELRETTERVLQEALSRPGSVEFRVHLLTAYESKCAISEISEPVVLEAAHIVPYYGETSDVVQNGILLRSDFHKLFDSAKIDFDYVGESELVVSWIESSVSDHYRQYLNKRILLPRSVHSYPSSEALAVRREFLGIKY